jgi:uncharacterized membrane protein YoaK (UPF0700 family)
LKAIHHQERTMQLALPRLLSANAGYVDTAAFLALKGLFTAHVTGNFVTLGAALVLGTSGALAKLLALPMFCAVVFFARLLAHRLRAGAHPVLRTLLALQLALLIAAAFVAADLGPFADGDSRGALVTGMTLVAAMALQNAAHRVHLAHAPPSTIMTGTTTQIMLDLADVAHGLQPELAQATATRLTQMSISVAAFAMGCALGALLYAWVDVWCFCVPPLLSGVALLLPHATVDAEPRR